MASFLILLSLAMGATGLIAFFWSMHDGQYDDLDGAAERILLDDQDGSQLPDIAHGSEDSRLR